METKIFEFFEYEELKLGFMTAKAKQGHPTSWKIRRGQGCI